MKRKPKVAYAFVIKDEPQLCVWNTKRDAKRAAKEVEHCGVSDIFEIPTQFDNKNDAYDLIDDCLRAFSSIGW